MGWVRVSDDFYDHPKFQSVTALGMAAWISGLAYCNRNLTDGFIPRRAALRLVDHSGVAVSGRDAEPDDGIAELLDAGLWVSEGAGYRIHDYLDYQPTGDKIREEKRKVADRVAKWREAHPKPSNARSNGVTSPVSNAVSNGHVTGAPTSTSTSTTNHLLTLVSRLTSGNERATTTDDLITYWQDVAGTADLETEAQAFLMHNANTELRNPRAAWHGWLRKAAERAGTPPLGCATCDHGWLDTGDTPRPCPTCKPHLRIVQGEAS